MAVPLLSWCPFVAAFAAAAVIFINLFDRGEVKFGEKCNMANTKGERGYDNSFIYILIFKSLKKQQVDI